MRKASSVRIKRATLCWPTPRSPLGSSASCFSLEGHPGGYGNANRTPLSGPGFVNLPISPSSSTLFRAKVMRVDFRTEFFNLFNHPQFGAPGGNIAGADFNSPTFAVVNYTVNNPRLIPVCALKLAF